MRGPTTIIAVLLIPLGLAVGAATALWFFVSWNARMEGGHGVTAPAAVELDVEPGEQVVWREMLGTHATVNRPVLDPPADLVIEVTDRRTGEAIAVRAYQWQVSQSVMPGVRRARRAVAAFDAPEHGEVVVRVSGSFAHEQVYRVAPSMGPWADSAVVRARVGLGAGLVMVIAGVGVLVGRALRQERVGEA